MTEEAQWLKLTHRLGPKAEAVFLSAIATQGYRVLGRGAIYIDLDNPCPDKTIGYCSADRWEEMLTDKLASRWMRDYEPSTEMIIGIVANRNSSMIGTEYVHGVVIYRLDQSSEGSPEAQQLAKEALLINPEVAIKQAADRETLEKLFKI